MVCEMHWSALECDNNYSPAITIIVADADSAESDLLWTTALE